MNIAFTTLGCKVNQYETQALAQLLTSRGHTLVPFEGEADAYIINTCTVTAISDKKSRQTIRRARRAAPESIIAVCGCYPQTHPEEMAGLGIDLVTGTGERTGFADLLEQTWASRQPVAVLDNALTRRLFEQLPPGGLEGRTRAMLKIEDGCVNFCSYCIIPFARGPVRSLPLEQAVQQAAQLARQGYKELVLTGIEIAAWGQDFGQDAGLIDLIEGVCAAAPGCRIRLGSLEPRVITPDFCARLARLDNLCPHFHLSLQSGSDGVLQRMNRRYDSTRYYESVKLLRGAFRHPAITTDLIVGFPGESQEEFDQSLAFIQQCQFSSMHIFPYSKRPGTPAAGQKDQILNAVKQARAAQAAQAAAAMTQLWLSQWVGARVEVLFEEQQDGLWRGYTPHYVPVAVSSDQPLHNQPHLVRLLRVDDGLVYGALE